MRILGAHSVTVILKNFVDLSRADLCYLSGDTVMKPVLGRSRRFQILYISIKNLLLRFGRRIGDI
jgi:hypothetical protein